MNSWKLNLKWLWHLLSPPDVGTKSLKNGEVQPRLLQQGPLEIVQALILHVKALSRDPTNTLLVRQNSLLQTQKLPNQRRIHQGRVPGTQQPRTVPNRVQRYPGRPTRQLRHRIEEQRPAHAVAERVVHRRAEGESPAREHRHLEHARVLHPLLGSRVGH